MTDELEAGLRKRDGRFLFRLGILLAIGLLAGVLVFRWLTDPSLATCAAEGFGTVTDPARNPP